MIIKLKGANFSTNNINALLNSYFVSITGGSCVTAASSISSVSKDSPTYSNTFTVNTDYSVSNVEVTMGGSVVSGAANVTTGEAGTVITISVPTVTNNLSIKFTYTYNGVEEPDNPGSGDVEEPENPGGAGGQITTTYDLASFVNVSNGQLATNTNTWIHSDFIPVNDLSNSTEDGKCVRTFVGHGTVAAIAFYSQPDFNSYVEGFILSNTAAAGATAQTAEQVKACITMDNANYVVFSTDGSKATLSVTTGEGSTVTPEPEEPETPSTGTSGVNYYDEAGFISVSSGQVTNPTSDWIHSDFIEISQLQDDATLGHCIGKFTGHSTVADIAFYSAPNFSSFIVGKSSAGPTKTVATLQALMTELNATNATHIVISTDKTKNQLYASLK